jgi:large subunit ribosomal protein L33
LAPINGISSRHELGLANSTYPTLYCSIPKNELAPVWGISCRGIVVMAKSKKKVEIVFLVCEETGDYNYTIRRKQGGEKLKLKKYSPRLRRHTLHNEKKK